MRPTSARSRIDLLTAEDNPDRLDASHLPLVYFVRHGQTSWNAEGRLQGQAETDVTAKGHAQVERNGRKMHEILPDSTGFDFVASPMRRTRDTMERVRKAMGLDPSDYRTDPRLMEVSFGDWQGHTYTELEAIQPGAMKMRSRDKWNFVPPNGESYQILLERVRPWIAAVTRQTVCVTHGGVLRTLFRMIESVSERSAARLEIHQDKILRLQAGRLTWI